MKKVSPSILHSLKFTFTAFCFVLLISCRQIHIYDSKAFILNRTTDTSLKDSSLIFGKVLTAPVGELPEPYADIWVENTIYKTQSDSTGFFSLKLHSGTYTVKGLGRYGNADMPIILKNITLLAGEKVEVQFLQGYIAE